MKHVISYRPIEYGHLWWKKKRWKIGVSNGAHFMWFEADTKEDGRATAVEYLSTSKAEHEEIEL